MLMTCPAAADVLFCTSLQLPVQIVMLADYAPFAVRKAAWHDVGAAGLAGSKHDE
jgi:hypothetical protein